MSVLGDLYKPEISKESHSEGSSNSASSNLHKTWQDGSTYTSAVCYKLTSVRQRHCNGELLNCSAQKNIQKLVVLAGK